MNDVCKATIGNREWTIQDMEDGKQVAFPSPDICCVYEDVEGWRPGRIYGGGVVLYGVDGYESLEDAAKIHSADPGEYVTEIRVKREGTRPFVDMVVSSAILLLTAAVWDIDAWMAFLGILIMHAVTVVHDVLDAQSLRG
jgi:hypothetical protein